MGHHNDHQQQHISWQRRSLYAFAAYIVATGMYDTAANGMFSPHSLCYIAAELTGVREWLSLGYSLCLAALLPFMIAQWRPCPSPRWTVTLLCLSCVTAALLWVGEAFVDRHADLELLPIQYLRYAIEALAFALLVAANYNANKLVKCSQDGMHGESCGSNWVHLK